MESEEMTDRHLKSSEKLFLRFTKLILDEDHISRKLESYAEQLCVTVKISVTYLQDGVWKNSYGNHKRSHD